MIPQLTHFANRSPACVFGEKPYNLPMQQVNRAGSVLSSPFKGLIFLAVGVLVLGWLLNTPPGLLGKADAIGYAVCHRIDVRSFHIGVRAIPLCARCSGMYLGAVLGLAYQAVLSRRRAGMPPWKVWVVLGAFVAGFALDGLNSFAHLIPGAPTLYQPQNWLRLLTGTGMGLAIAGMVYPAFNQTVWRDTNRAPAIGGLKVLAPLIVLALFLDWLVLAENPLILYPLSLVSAAGVIGLLTIVYTMMWLMILRVENSFSKVTGMVLPLAAGFGMAFLQIIILDLLRFALTGTWDGFHLG